MLIYYSNKRTQKLVLLFNDGGESLQITYKFLRFGEVAQTENVGQRNQACLGRHTER